MKILETFQPDLIIEATNACNKSCRGCYAPNIVVDAKTATTAAGALFLDAGTLEHSWASAVGDVQIVAIRGGEPSLNPHLPELMKYASSRSEAIYLETNGDWIVEAHPLFQAIRELGVVVKLSVDSMHGSTHGSGAIKTAAQLKILESENILTAVAITEATEADFQRAVDNLLQNYKGQIFKQVKASRASDLVKPTVGVITTTGNFVGSVTSRFQNALKATIQLAFVGLILSSGLVFSKAHADRKITVGLAANFSAMSDSTSNPYANYFRNAIEMAFDQSKDKLKAKGLEIQLKEFDYSDDKLKVIVTANDAVQSNAVAVIGYIYSSDALLAGPIFARNKLLMLSPTATADRIEEIGHFVRRTCFNDSYQGKILGDYAWKTQKVRTVAIVSVADCAYCQSLRTAFKERFEALGGKVTLDQTILSTDSNFDELTQSLKTKKFDAIFVPNYERVSATLISTLYDAGVKPRLWLGGDGWGNSVDLFYRIVGKRKFKAYTISHWHPDIDTAKSKHFLSEFTRRYGKSPVDTAVLAYDAAELLIQALLNASNYSREGILEAVEKIRVLDGVTGRLVYPNSSRTPEKPAVLLKFENGLMSVERIIGG